MESIERRKYSQNGEDGILEFIFSSIGVTNRLYLEIGTGDGSECNTRNLRESHGFGGIMIDSGYEIPQINLRKRFVTVENIKQLVNELCIPSKLDLLSLDIDFNDWYVMRELLKYIDARVIVVEYNASLGPETDAVVIYDAMHNFDGTTYFGSSLMGWKHLLSGYGHIGCDSNGVNAFFVKSSETDKLPDDYKKMMNSVELYRPPEYRPPHNNYNPGHMPDPLNRPFYRSVDILSRK